MFITAFTSALHLSRSSAYLCSGRTKVSVQIRGSFPNPMRFLGEDLLAPRPTPKLEEHPLSAVSELFNIFAATLHIAGRSSIRNLSTHHAVVTQPTYHMPLSTHHAVVTEPTCHIPRHKIAISPACVKTRRHCLGR
jgi:hypothetical protein